MSKEVNALEPIVDIFIKAGKQLIGYKTKNEIKSEKEAIERIKEEKIKEYNKKKEKEIENKNKITEGKVTYDFNNLFINCGLKNKLKDMPILESVKHYSTVDIYSFKLPIGVTVTAVKEKLEQISDFFEVPQMSVKLQKKNNLMDIIISKVDMYNKTYNFQELPMNTGLKIPVGHFINQDYLEKLLVIDISKDDIPHGFVGSTTGGGKSNFILSFLLNWIMTKSPEDLELFLIDGKGGTDYSSLLQAPHIYKNTCFTDILDVMEVLELNVAEMERRNKIFFKSGVKNFREYNATRGHIPHRVIIFDEYAMYCDDKQNYSSIQAKVGKICSMGRSAGIHIIVATQDARQKILDSMIKYNMPLKIGFKCDNTQHSINISGYQGLETINKVGVGRVYGLPIDTEYVQFKSILTPKSDVIRKMIEEKYPMKNTYKEDSEELEDREYIIERTCGSNVINLQLKEELGEECD